MLNVCAMQSKQTNTKSIALLINMMSFRAKSQRKSTRIREYVENIYNETVQIVHIDELVFDSYLFNIVARRSVSSRRFKEISK